MLFCPVTEQLCLVLCTVNYGLMSDWVTRAIPNFFIGFRINKISNFVAAKIIQFLQTFILYIAKTLASVSFAKYSSFTSPRRALRSSLLSKHPLFHRIPCKFLVPQTACFWTWYFFGGQKNYY